MKHNNATLVLETEDGEEIEIGELEYISLSIKKRSRSYQECPDTPSEIAYHISTIEGDTDG